MKNMEMNYYADHNMAMNRHYIAPFATILVPLDRSRSQLFNGTNIVANGTI